jgi:magnesium transporter
MRVFHISGDQFSELDGLPESLPPTGYLWVGSARREFEVQTPMLQAALQRWTGGQLVDVHIADLLNNQLPSHFDYTSWYDMLVFRRLAAGEGSAPLPRRQRWHAEHRPRRAGRDRHQPGRFCAV